MVWKPRVPLPLAIMAIAFLLPYACRNRPSILPSTTSIHIPDEKQDMYIAAQSNLPYQAPLMVGHRPQDRIPNSYDLVLAAGYSIEQHKETIGTYFNLNTIYEFYDDATGVTNYGTLLSDAELAIVRADVGVTRVEESYSLMIPEDDMIE